MNWDDNAEARLAHDLVLHTSSNLFLTGKAGTGKTTFLRNLCQELKKNYVIVAPTGIAALNAEGSTLHSQFQLPIAPYLPARDPQAPNPHLKAMRQEKRIVIENLRLIIIDEVSMVRADTLQALSDRLCMERQSSLPFAGVQLLLIGDLYQLPPVTDTDWAQLQPEPYRTPYFLSAPALKNTSFYFLELQKIYRQKDQVFINLLQAIRTGKELSTALQRLNQRVTDSEIKLEPGEVVLTSLREQSANYNQKCLDEIAEDSFYYYAEVSGEFPEKDVPTDVELELKVGAQVMFVRNDNESGLFVNGELGIVTTLSEREVTVRKMGGGMPITVKAVRWERYSYDINYETRKMEKKVIGRFVQIPLRLAWSITIHKSQGLTFDRVSIHTQGIFASGQLYVALSRCRSLEGIQLNATVPMSAVKVDERIARAIDYCKKNYALPKDYVVDISKSNNLDEQLSGLDYDEEGKEISSARAEYIASRIQAYIDRKAPVVGILKEPDISISELESCVNTLLENGAVELKSVLTPRSYSSLKQYYALSPQVDLSTRSRALKGIVPPVELRWFDRWRVKKS